MINSGREGNLIKCQNLRKERLEASALNTKRLITEDKKTNIKDKFKRLSILHMQKSRYTINKKGENFANIYFKYKTVQ